MRSYLAIQTKSYNVFSDDVRRALNVTSEKYDKNKMKLTITHKGNKEIKSFYYIYCSICHKDSSIPRQVQRQLPSKPQKNDLTEAQDNLGLSTDTFDLAGCILPDQTHAHAAPHGNRFILRPNEHATIHIKLSSGKGVEATINVN